MDQLQISSHLQTAMLDEEREKNRELRTQIERLQNRVCLNTAGAQTHVGLRVQSGEFCIVEPIHYRASRLIVSQF